MPLITKPDNLNFVWSSAGDKITPSQEKIQQGWVQEIPPRQIFNFIDGRQDQFNAYVNQHGIVGWDEDTDYFAGKSYVQDDVDGTVWRAVNDNTNSEPSSTNADWAPAFVTVDGYAGGKRYVGYEFKNADFLAVSNHRYYLSTPMVVSLPETANNGDAITMTKNPNIIANIKVDSGVINTSLGSDTNVSFDLNDEINFVFTSTGWVV